MKLHRILLASIALGVCLAAMTATAATVSYGPVSFGPATTNWTNSLAMQKWDPVLFPGQVLTGISFSLTGSVSGDAKFESLDTAPATVTMNLQSQITLYDPSNNPLVVVLPVVSTSDNVTAFDGVIDFGGTSGKSYLGLSNSASMSGSSVDFPTFTGSGTIALPIKALGTSNGSGAGNLLQQFNTSAGAEATVTYTYVPEPSSFVIAGLGLASLAGYRLSRRKQ